MPRFDGNFARVLALAGFLLASGSAAAQTAASGQDYRIGVGDTLSLWVSGMPELSMRLPVSTNGNITVPLAGETKAAGLTLSEVSSSVAQLFSRHTIFQTSVDGRSIGVTISQNQVVVRVDEYRPVYVSGDVAKPGALTFRPGMTVRQAISVAGGYEMLRATGSRPVSDAFDLRSQKETLWIDYAQTLATLRRVEAEINDANTLDVGNALSGLPVDARVAADIVDSTKKKLAYNLEDLANQRNALSQTLAMLAKSASVLSEELKRENDGVAQDEKDLASMQDLFKQNTIPVTRLMDARRAVLLSSTRALQTQTQLNGILRQKSDAENERQKLDDQRRTTLQTEFEQAQLRLASLRSQLGAVADKMLYASAIRSQFSDGVSTTRKAQIYRSVDGKVTPIETTSDTILEPGDVVEVTFDPGGLQRDIAPNG